MPGLCKYMMKPLLSGWRRLVYTIFAAYFVVTLWLVSHITQDPSTSPIIIANVFWDLSQPRVHPARPSGFSDPGWPKLFFLKPQSNGSSKHLDPGKPSLLSVRSQSDGSLEYPATVTRRPNMMTTKCFGGMVIRNKNMRCYQAKDNWGTNLHTTLMSLKDYKHPEDMTSYMNAKDFAGADLDLLYPAFEDDRAAAGPESDRILRQLGADTQRSGPLAVGNRSTKTIFMFTHARGKSVNLTEQQCVVDDCHVIFSSSSRHLQSADVVVVSDDKALKTSIPGPRPANQVWMWYQLESLPQWYVWRGGNTKEPGRRFNWTATFRHDSTIVAPYEKYVPYNRSHILRAEPLRNYAQGKTKKVAWFSSNCHPLNNRQNYVHQLMEYIAVDVYGTCGTLTCPRVEHRRCIKMLDTDYKFYLAFENSNCRDYITEKFLETALDHDVIPIVMGAPPEDYERVAPPHSYIHVDDFDSPKDLAIYLHYLDNNDKLYSEYFAWKGLWTKIDTKFLCRVCALAHDIERAKPVWKEDLQGWFNGPHCLNAGFGWRSQPRPLYPLNYTTQKN